MFNMLFNTHSFNKPGSTNVDTDLTVQHHLHILYRSNIFNHLQLVHHLFIKKSDFYNSLLECTIHQPQQITILFFKVNKIL